MIHTTSIVDSGAIVCPGCKIWHFCHIGSGAYIDADTTIGQNCYIAPGVRVGKRVKIQNNVSVFNGVEIDDDCFIGPNVTFTNVKNPRSFIDRKAEFQATKIGFGSSLGANSTIVCGVVVGRFALVGAGSVVTRDTANYAVVTGNPACQVGWISESGQKLIFDKSNVAVDQSDGSKYLLKHNEVTRIK